MRSLLGSSRLWAVAGGCLLLAIPAQAQTKNCQGSASTTTASTASSSSSTTGTTSGTAQSRLAQIQNQIAQLEALLARLQSGQVDASSSTGLTNAQAAQVVQARINLLRQQANQIRSLAVAQSQRGTAASAIRAGGAGGRR